MQIFPRTKLAEIALEEGLITDESELLAPTYYQPERVLEELHPYLTRRTRHLPRCVVYNRWARLFGMLQRNLFLSGSAPAGLIGMSHYPNQLSVRRKLRLMGTTALDLVLPSRLRYVPTPD